MGELIYVDFLRKIKLNRPMRLPELSKVNRLIGRLVPGSLRNYMNQIRRLAEDEERRKREHLKQLLNVSKGRSERDPYKD